MKDYKSVLNRIVSTSNLEPLKRYFDLNEQMKIEGKIIDPIIKQNGPFWNQMVFATFSTISRILLSKTSNNEPSLITIWDGDGNKITFDVVEMWFSIIDNLETILEMSKRKD